MNDSVIEQTFEFNDLTKSTISNKFDPRASDKQTSVVDKNKNLPNSRSNGPTLTTISS